MNLIHTLGEDAHCWGGSSSHGELGPSWDGTSLQGDGVWVLFRHSARTTRDTCLHTTKNASNPRLVSHSTPQHKAPAQSPSHLPMPGPVTLCCLPVLCSWLPEDSRTPMCHPIRTEGKVALVLCPAPPESQQGWLLLHRQALHTRTRSAEHSDMRRDGRVHNSTRKGWRTDPT